VISLPGLRKVARMSKGSDLKLNKVHLVSGEHGAEMSLLELLLQRRP